MQEYPPLVEWLAPQRANCPNASCDDTHGTAVGAPKSFLLTMESCVGRQRPCTRRRQPWNGTLVHQRRFDQKSKVKVKSGPSPNKIAKIKS